MAEINLGNYGWEIEIADRARLAEAMRKYYEAVAEEVKKSMERRSLMPKDWRSRIIY